MACASMSADQGFVRYFSWDLDWCASGSYESASAEGGRGATCVESCGIHVTRSVLCKSGEAEEGGREGRVDVDGTGFSASVSGLGGRGRKRGERGLCEWATFHIRPPAVPPAQNVPWCCYSHHMVSSQALALPTEAFPVLSPSRSAI
eukprot:354941-Chlamydomonas_euryale.AAC.6